jgi:hypothetical protein
MVRRWKAIERFALHGSDGNLGVVDDALVDERWVVRYLVVAPGTLQHQRVVISPVQVGGIDWARDAIDVRLSSAQLRESPDLLAVTPLTRDAEAAYASYYGYPAYWGGPGLWGWAGRPGALGGPPPPSYRAPEGAGEPSPLQSAKLLRGRHLAALDGGIGHVDDAFVDEASWRLTYLLVDTSNWIGGRHVLVPTAVVSALGVAGPDLLVDRTIDRIRDAPEYDADRPVDAAMEQTLARHYAADARLGARGAGGA